MEKTFRNGFGKEYTVEIPSREELEKKAAEIDFEKVAEQAYEHYSPGGYDGVVYFDIENGEVYGSSQGSNERRVNNHDIEIYRLESNTEFPDEDLIEDNNELEEAEKKDMYVEEYLEEKGVLEERKLVVIECWVEEFCDKIDEDFKEELDEIFNNDELDCDEVR